MKICCKDYKNLIENIDHYPSFVIANDSINDDIMTFSLAIYNNRCGHSWYFLTYCPFCGSKKGL